MTGLSPSKANESINKAIDQQISLTLKKLLEEKHLYQSLDVEVDALAAAIADDVEPVHYKGRNFREELKFDAVRRLATHWFVLNPSGSYKHSQDCCSVIVSHIKTFCTDCDRIEPFNLLAATDYFEAATSHPLARTPEFMGRAGRVQNFVLSFLCQGCKRIPEVFMVRRVGAKLTICGRSPIEHVEVPAFIPKIAEQYVSGAIVAHQSGQTLAGLFLLRTFIEQWIRKLGANHDKADQAIDWYMSTLPDDFKQHYPSLRKIYEDLSDAIHKANGSAALFDKARAEIEEHFDARRLRKLPEPKFSSA